MDLRRIPAIKPALLVQFQDYAPGFVTIGRASRNAFQLVMARMIPGISVEKILACLTVRNNATVICQILM